MSVEIYKGQAIKKLEEKPKKKMGNKESAMAPCVKQTLIGFCNQSEEFAQAVAQGESFEDCMAYVAKGIKGNSISDLEAYKRAAQFYFPTATISFVMTINTEGNNALAADTPEEPQSERNESEALSMSLDDLLGL